MTNEDIFCAWIVCGVAGLLIGAFRGRKVTGMVLGFLFGPIGWVILFCLGESNADDDTLVTAGGFLLVIALLIGARFVYEDQFGNLQRVTARLSPEHRSANSTPAREATRPQAAFAAAPPPREVVNRVPYVARRSTPVPTDVNAEILRKYGARP